MRDKSASVTRLFVFEIKQTKSLVSIWVIDVFAFIALLLIKSIFCADERALGSESIKIIEFFAANRRFASFDSACLDEAKIYSNRLNKRGEKRL